ncbi:MAG: hypothetical protein H7836_15620 [Magnetococcus sp. YQC-3]
MNLQFDGKLVNQRTYKSRKGDDRTMLTFASDDQLWSITASGVVKVDDAKIGVTLRWSLGLVPNVYQGNTYFTVSSVAGGAVKSDK